MHVDLSDKCEQFLIQTYVDSILNAASTEELMFDIHKLIHTYQVVQSAKDLIKLTTPKPNEKMTKMIIDGAVLHDIGRVKQFSKGQFIMNANHAHMGAVLLEDSMPDYTEIIETTRWHSNPASDKDPTEIVFILNYIRDADMIANLRYNVAQPDLFFNQTKGIFDLNGLNCQLDMEVQKAFEEKRPLYIKNLKNCSFLNAMLNQLFWIYNFRTKAAFEISQTENLFPRFRDLLIGLLMDKLEGTHQEKSITRNEILMLFSDSFFAQNIERLKNDL